jgi:hypothetical protein
MRLRRSSPRRIRARTSPQFRLRIMGSRPWAGRAMSRSVSGAPHTSLASASRPRPASSSPNSRSASRNTDRLGKAITTVASGPSRARLEQGQARHTVEPAGRHEVAAVPGEQAPEPLVEDLAGPAQRLEGGDSVMMPS